MGVCLCVYFSFHILAGQRSILTLMDLRAQKQSVAAQTALYTQQKEQLEKKVVMLRPDTLNADFAEELIIRKLGYQSPRQLIVLNAAQQ